MTTILFFSVTPLLDTFDDFVDDPDHLMQDQKLWKKKNYLVEVGNIKDV